MKVMVVNGSPRGAKGNTEVLVEAFLEGARSAGAETEVIYLAEKRIEHCVGCFTCWTGTPGVCIHKDDMPELLEKIRATDVGVFAMPLYVYSVPGLMKDFMDRIIPLAHPFAKIENGISTHPPRYGDTGNQTAVFISNSGFPEQDHFAGLRETARCWYRGSSRKLAGMICCAGGGILRNPSLRDSVKWYLDATRAAGEQIVRDGMIAEATQKMLDTPLIPDQELFVSAMNAHWMSLGVTPPEGWKG